MPAISPTDLVGAISDAIRQSGYSVALTSPMRAHPRKFIATSQSGDSISLWIYAWTLTPGGRPSLPDEYRIQMTTVTSPLNMNPMGLTLLLGYEVNSGNFGGFDIERHSAFTTGSPSVQIALSAVRNAQQYGLTFNQKDNDEIAVGIRPDQFINYALNAEHLHEFGSQPATFRLLEKASGLEAISPEELESLPDERRRIVQKITRLSRKANFRQQVLQAYGDRCAVTRMQLRLVEGAHILPVGAPDSSDHVTNGLALSPTYHRAYDAGLIYLDESYEMRINPQRVAELKVLSLIGGLSGFKTQLGKILLPPDRGQWPKPVFIRKANKFRMIA